MDNYMLLRNADDIVPNEPDMWRRNFGRHQKLKNLILSFHIGNFYVKTIAKFVLFSTFLY